MAYNFTTSDGLTPIVVTDNTIGSAPALTVDLLGKNYSGYGTVMARTIVQLLEHFSSASAPANAIRGQVWYDKTGSGALKVYDGTEWRTLLGSTITDGDIELTTNIIPVPDCSGATADCGTGTGINLGSEDNKFCSIYAENLCGVASSARYADLAERYEADSPYAVGTLVKIGGSKEITQTTQQFDTDVFGIISARPGMMLNSAAGNDITHPYVGLSGRVMTRVVGKVSKGQRLVASDVPGVAMAVNTLNNVSPYSVVGRALTNKDDKNEGQVLVSIGAK